MKIHALLRKIALPLAAACALWSGLAIAQDDPLGGGLAEEQKFEIVSVTADPATVPAGGTTQVRVKIEIVPDWHLYGLKYGQPPRIELDLPEGLTAGALSEFPEPHEIARIPDMPDLITIEHEAEVTFSIAVTVAPDAALGPRTIGGSFSAMACDPMQCLPEETRPIEASFVVTEWLGPETGGNGASPVVPGAGEPEEMSGGVGGIIGSGVFWGLITLLTPCVFPLLPVTVSFFSKQEGAVLPKALVYAFGIIFTLTVVGLIFGASLDVMARGDAFNVFVGVLFVVLALSLFGLFDLRLPGFLTDATTKRSSATGLIGPFFMAMTLALTSFSCSIPFLAIMFTTFEEGDKSAALIGLLAYSVTVAVPFFFCSLFPALLKTMPRAGGWMNAVKVTMGFVEFGLAFKFFRTVAINHDWDILPRTLVLAIWAACAFAAAMYLFGIFSLPKDTKVETVGTLRMLFAVMFFSLGLYIVPGLFGRPLASDLEGFIQTEPKDLWIVGDGGSAGDTAHLEWPRNDWEGARERAIAADRYVLFDFTGKG